MGRMHGRRTEIMGDLVSRIKQLEKELRNARKAVRLAYRSDWMVDIGWTDGETRDNMWEQVKKLAGIKRWTYGRKIKKEATT